MVGQISPPEALGFQEFPHVERFSGLLFPPHYWPWVFLRLIQAFPSETVERLGTFHLGTLATPISMGQEPWVHGRIGIWQDDQSRFVFA